ncbi:MAG: hypothetical protein RL380_1226 [Verrucomicrobiota bacterium]
MTAVAANWSRLRWTGVITLVFAAQFAFIFLLGTRKPNTPRRTFPAPQLVLAAEPASEKLFPLADLADPTLFSLPHARGFSGQARALTPRTRISTADSETPFHWLPLRTENLGFTLRQLVADNLAGELPFAEKIRPLPSPLVLPTLPAAASAPAIRYAGALAGRAPLLVPELPPQRAVEPVPDTEVQALVDAAGHVVTATVLSHGGSADAIGLALARQLRFTPLPGGGNTRVVQPLAGLTLGRIIFHWRTESPAETTATP